MLRELKYLIQEMLGQRKLQYFKEGDFRAREIYRDDYKCVADSLLKHIPFNTVYDVGCANCFLISEFLSAKKVSRGIELSADIVKLLPAEIRHVVDIGDFSQAKGEWDLVCCVEVAEHIVPSMSKPLVQKLTKLARNYIYFTAAPPGQPGVGHINCRPHSDWIKWFQDNGWSKDIDRTHALREDLKVLKNAIWLKSNSFIFKRI